MRKRKKRRRKKRATTTAEKKRYNVTVGSWKKSCLRFDTYETDVIVQTPLEWTPFIFID
jgi:hypothetical protein